MAGKWRRVANLEPAADGSSYGMEWKLHIKSKEKTLSGFYDWKPGSQWSVPVKALPGNAEAEVNKRERGEEAMNDGKTWFYCSSPSNCSRKDLSQWAVNTTSLSQNPHPPAIFILTLIYFMLFCKCSHSATRSNAIFKVPSAYEVIHPAFYFNCSFLFAHWGWSS